MKNRVITIAMLVVMMIGLGVLAALQIGEYLWLAAAVCLWFIIDETRMIVKAKHNTTAN